MAASLRAVLKLNRNKKVISESGYQFELEKPLPKHALQAGTAHTLLTSFVSIWCAKLAEMEI